jgi:ABC-type lipoprotein release transport system permease subunit
MKCLGALDRFVVRLFLLESGFQGLAGALIGALIGCLGSLLLGLKDYGLDLFFYFPLLPVLNEQPARFGVLLIILAGCVLGMILAVIGAAFPAWRAAKLPPAEAMRTEV